jgi:hypothetical protein
LQEQESSLFIAGENRERKIAEYKASENDSNSGMLKP